MQEVKWYEHVAVKDKGRIVQVAAYDRCLKCGLTFESYPLYTWSDLLAKFHSDKRFAADFMAAQQVVNVDVHVRALKPASFAGTRSIGLRIETEYWVITRHHFVTFYKVARKSVEGLRLFSGVCDETGEPMTGVLVKKTPQSVPPLGLAVKTAIMYCDVGNVVTEYVMPFDWQIRAEQAAETMKFVVNSQASSYGDSWKTTQRNSLLSFSAIDHKAAELRTAQAAEAVAVASLLGGAAGFALAPRRGLQTASVTAIPGNAMHDKAKKRFLSGATASRQSKLKKDAAAAGQSAPSGAIELACNSGASRRSDGSETAGEDIDVIAILNGAMLGRTRSRVTHLALVVRMRIHNFLTTYTNISFMG